MAVVALKPESVDVTRVSNWFRPPFTTENLRAVLEHPQADVFRWIANSAAVAVLTTCGVLLVCTLAAFAFSRIRFPGKNAVFVLVMVGMMIPREAMLVPLYTLFQSLGLLNTFFSLIAPSLAAPFAVIILKSFFSTACPAPCSRPPASTAAAGCAPALGSRRPCQNPRCRRLAILVFMQSWNDFLWPFISITEPSKVTIPVGLPVFRSQYLTGQGLTMAAGALLAFPSSLCSSSFKSTSCRGWPRPASGLNAASSNCYPPPELGSALHSPNAVKGRCLFISALFPTAVLFRLLRPDSRQDRGIPFGVTR